LRHSNSGSRAPPAARGRHAAIKRQSSGNQAAIEPRYNGDQTTRSANLPATACAKRIEGATGRAKNAR